MVRAVYMIILGLFMFNLNLNAQCPLEEAVDFNVVDINGNNVNLFNLLQEENKYVLIDFFFASCEPCQNSAPYVNQAFEYFGCGEYDVEFIAISNQDSDEVCHEFDDTYGVTYTTISGIEGNGAEIVANYQIQAFPTIILIDPDGNIVEQDIYPIVDEYSVINPLETYNITQNTCLTHIYEKTEVSDIKIFPNPTNTSITLEFPDSEMYQIEISDINGHHIFSENKTGISKLDLSKLKAGIYLIKAVSNKKSFTEKLIIR